MEKKNNKPFSAKDLMVSAYLLNIMGWLLNRVALMEVENMAKKEKVEEAEEVEQTETTQAGKKRPTFQVVQVERGADGKTVFRQVGAVWENTSKSGKEFYTLKIGNLRLLLFPSENGDK